MKVKREKLTPGYINKITSRSEKYFISDSSCPGLAIRVQPIWKNKKGEEQQGKKVWVWHYRPRGKESTRMTLGRTEHLSPAEARR